MGFPVIRVPMCPKRDRNASYARGLPSRLIQRQGNEVAAQEQRPIAPEIGLEVGTGGDRGHWYTETA